MKMKVSDYVAQFLVDKGIEHVFTVTGGGAMHLNDSLGHHKGLKCMYNHHEQACAIAAESYARIHNKIAAVCVTTGPGGINAMNGVAGGYLDSIPMLIISGQVRYDTTARSTGLNLRAMGDQEFDITKAVDSMTKYCQMITDPLEIKYCLEKAYYLATTGRPGPCWIDIPVNIQGMTIETDDLYSYDCKEEVQVPKIEKEIINTIIEKIRNAKRPVLYAGNGIRISGGHSIFMEVIEKLNIPVVTCWDSIDAIYDEHPLYVGRGGIMGDRAGNFAVQNSDFLLAIGNRLSIRQVGYNFKTWAREAFVVVNDIDKEELKKPTIHVDLSVWGDAYDLLQQLNESICEPVFNKEDWLTACANWKKNYPVVQEKHFKEKEKANVYALIHTLSGNLEEGQITVVGNGSACVVGSQAYQIKKGQRFIVNSAIASMGYDLPAAIGACVADHKKDTICVTGDGSIQMNLQELQTIRHHNMPMKIFVINNEGYHSIRQTQTNFFGEPLVGVGNDSGDLSFPSMEKLAYAYDIPYVSIHTNSELNEKIQQTLGGKGPVICEIFVDKEQKFEPKSATKRLEDGTLVSPPLEDLAPFLPREELEKNMFIPLLDEQ